MQGQRSEREADLVQTDAADVRADAEGLRDLTNMGAVAARGQLLHVQVAVHSWELLWGHSSVT